MNEEIEDDVNASNVDEVSWPREILIQPTTEKAIEILGDHYESSRDPEGDDELMFQIGFEFRNYAQIESWDDFAKNYEGYEIVEPAMREEYDFYLESQDHRENEDLL